MYGHSITETVEYQDPDYAIKVIRRAWSDYEVQDALIGWLGQLARDATEQVRIFAGIALGRLAIWSFDFLSCNVLGPWANGKVKEQREAVAYALRVVAADPRLRGNVRQLMSGWYANSGRPLAQATAARAYGVAYGPIDPVRGVQATGPALLKSTTSGSRPPSATASLTCSRRAATSSPARCCPGSRNPSTEPERSATRATGFPDRRGRAGRPGAGCCWRESGVLAYPAPPDDTPGRGPVRHRALWRYVLNEALFYEEAEQVMTRWAAAAEGNPAVREAFLRLARAIARGDRRSLMILERYCAQWVSAGNLSPLPVVSAALQTILTAEKEAR